MLEELLTKEEGKTIEFKENTKSLQKIVQTIVAFANTAGGTLVIGIKDKTKDVIGLANVLEEEERIANEDDYYVRELYWGSFSRNIQLPEEIDVDEAEAVEKHGLLILKLPKLDKKRSSKLKVKTV